MLNPGAMLQNRYRVVSSLGQGGMGAVYRVRDTRLNIDLALKEMTPQSGLDAVTLAQLRHQFEQEASILARLDHPNLVDVTDFFEEGGNAYLVMKFVDGESLADRIERDAKLPEGEVLAWADQLLDALGYCHAQGVIHRDIKPQNVIVRPDGRAVLVDFGLVKLWDPNDPRTKTAMRGMGTPEYAPPEQYDVQGSHTDPRSDIYGLGATLYHALTGQAPPTATQRMSALTPFSPVRDLNPQVSAELSTAISKAMELPVPNRFGSAAEMRAALKDKARAPRQTPAVASPAPRPAPSMPAPQPPPAPPREATKVMPRKRAAARPWWKRIPGWTWAAGGVGAVVLFVVLVVALSSGVPATALPTLPVVHPTRTPLSATATPMPPTSTPVKETFDDPTLPEWEHSRETVVTDGVLKLTPGSFALRFGDLADITLTARLRFSGEGEVLVGYYMRDEGRYGVLLREGLVILEKEQRESHTVLGTAEGAPVQQNTWLTLKVVVTGEQHQIYVNNELLITATDPDPLGAGAVLLHTMGDVTAEFDELEVWGEGSATAE